MTFFALEQSEKKPIDRIWGSENKKRVQPLAKYQNLKGVNPEPKNGT